MPRLAAHRGRKQKGEATSGTRRGRGRMSRRHRRPLPGLAAARGAARDRAAAPRAVRPPRCGHCVPADSRSRAVSQQSPVLPASPSPPKPRAESHRVAARPRRGSGRPRKKEQEMEDETTGEERKKPPPTDSSVAERAKLRSLQTNYSIMKSV